MSSGGAKAAGGHKGAGPLGVYGPRRLHGHAKGGEPAVLANRVEPVGAHVAVAARRSCSCNRLSRRRMSALLASHTLAAVIEQFAQIAAW